MDIYKVPFTTAANIATVYTERAKGRVYCIFYEYGDADTGMKIVVTGNDTGVPIFTLDGTGTADVTWYPREAAHKVADGQATTVVDEEQMPPVFHEKIKIVITEATGIDVGTFYIGVKD